LGKQAALNDEQHFVAFDRLAALVLAGGEVVNRLEKIDVVERFPLAGLEGKDKHALGRVANGNGEPFEKVKRLVAQGGVVKFDAAGADEVFENFIQQNEVCLVSKELDDVVAAGCDTRSVVLADDFVPGLLLQKRPEYHAAR
jgi:hypothetical protein